MKKANNYVESAVIHPTSYKTVATDMLKKLQCTLRIKIWKSAPVGLNANLDLHQNVVQQSFFLRPNQEPGSPSHWKKMPLLEEPLLKDKSMSWQCFFKRSKLPHVHWKFQFYFFRSRLVLNRVLNMSLIGCTVICRGYHLLMPWRW